MEHPGWFPIFYKTSSKVYLGAAKTEDQIHHRWSKSNGQTQGIEHFIFVYKHDLRNLLDFLTYC